MHDIETLLLSKGLVFGIAADHSFKQISNI